MCISFVLFDLIKTFEKVLLSTFATFPVISALFWKFAGYFSSFEKMQQGFLIISSGLAEKCFQILVSQLVHGTFDIGQS